MLSASLPVVYFFNRQYIYEITAPFFGKEVKKVTREDLLAERDQILEQRRTGVEDQFNQNQAQNED